MRNLKFLAIFISILAVFMGCEDEKADFIEQNETIPIDVPISQIDANVSIDENLPPEPAIEDDGDRI